jgi:hypothetical protein
VTIPELIQQIEETERLIAEYRNANEVIVGTLAAQEHDGRQLSAHWRRCLVGTTTDFRGFGLRLQPALPTRASSFREAPCGCFSRRLCWLTTPMRQASKVERPRW